MKRMRKSVSNKMSVSAVLAVVVRSSCSERRSRASDARRAVTSWVTPTRPCGAPAASNRGLAIVA